MPQIQYSLSVEMEDGTTYDAVADQRDVARFEIQPFGTSAGEMTSRIYTSMRFLAWSALDRKGLLPKGMDWSRFDRECIEVVDTPGADDTPKGGKKTP
jgi:hypothetical protein